MTYHPADETWQSQAVHGILPCFLAVGILIISLIADIRDPGDHWLQRAGSVTTLFGAYVAYVDAKRSWKIIGGDVFINTMLPYKWISVVLILIGTAIWGYGDLLI